MLNIQCSAGLNLFIEFQDDWQPLMRFKFPKKADFQHTLLLYSLIVTAFLFFGHDLFGALQLSEVFKYRFFLKNALFLQIKLVF